MAARFEEAYDAARVRYTIEEWATLKPAERAEAIYREMHRIDAEHAAGARAFATKYPDSQFR